jgi:hypothetical protein
MVNCNGSADDELEEDIVPAALASETRLACNRANGGMAHYIHTSSCYPAASHLLFNIIL